MSAVIPYNEDNYSDFEWFEGFAVIRFYADWCKPCVQNFSVFEELTTQYAGHDPEIKFGKINVDQSPILTLRYNYMEVIKFHPLLCISICFYWYKIYIIFIKVSYCRLV